MAQSTVTSSGETRRHQVISEALAHKLSEAELRQALRICDEDFETDEDFSASEFCQRLTTTLPDTQLGKQTRLLVLHNVRQPVPSQSAEAISNRSSFSPVQPVSSTPAIPGLMGPERRRSQRKVTRLTGSYVVRESNRSGYMVVENLSETGARLHLRTPSSLKRGEPIVVQFVLDDSHQTPINLKARVTWAVYDTVGIAFTSPTSLPQVLVDYIKS